MNLALFDLDNTLLAGDSDFQWAQFLIEQRVLDREVYEAQNVEFYEQYKSGTLDIHAFLDFQLKPLSRHPRSQLDAWHSEFMKERILPLITPDARKLINKHMIGKDLCVIITATNRFVTAPIAQELGISNLIATEAEQRDGEYTGRVSGVPCFREGKIARLESWLDEHNLTWLSFLESWFYSDSLNDLPLLNKVTHPVAVDPDATLKAHAEKKGWPIISLR
ncbi:HAD-superfamily subfamily IB hydrolase, TIGR01490 [Nitrosospira sp. Nsp11]|uniref:histidinol-phosphatase n=1 Tax=unclassified Nitrosospira TaxID=2609267 RepID=UPI000880E1C1|nr:MULTISPECIES: HAD family hydrolase [unclassified Nitrosospira]SDA24000.1 HAD-superfamily subfamily IB hydrolase, TIGR01490 [Nitrosospira sp. Nsp18]SHM17135.1 HAD-superfamily subfamily IB hydrolase, TIGR01490 [Nitrosospira sp. Nsp11]